MAWRNLDCQLGEAVRAQRQMKLKHIDNERAFDWGKTSDDYSRFRPGYPEEFYDLLSNLGIGRRGQSILDLGTGTGVLARAFAHRGAGVVGVDASAEQIRAAMAAADAEKLDVDFRVGAAEEVDFPVGTFDAVTAGQSWLYFDAKVVVPKVLSFLKREGPLVLTHLLWLPEKDRVARASEELVLKHNPDWRGGGYSGTLPPVFPWAADEFDLQGYHVVEQPLSFTRESWRGRFRACRGIGAALSPEAVAEFDREHDKLLQGIAEETFAVWHQMTVHIFVRRGVLG